MTGKVGITGRECKVEHHGTALISEALKVTRCAIFGGGRLLQPSGLRAER